MAAITTAELEALVTADTSDFDAGMNRASGKVQGFGAAAARYAAMAGAAIVGGLAVGGAAATKLAADFEFQMDAVNAALGGIDTSVMQQLEQQALDLGQATKFSAQEVGRVQEELGRSGIDAQQLLDGATQSVLDLSAATGEDLVTSGQAAAAMLNLFNLDAAEMAGVADTLTAALNNSSMSLPDLQRGMLNLGPVMANLNRYANDQQQAFEDSAAAIAYFNSIGLKGADVGISLARGIQNLSTAGSEAQQTLADLGINAFDLNGNLLPLPDFFDQLNRGMAGMSDQAREAALATIFGAEAADVMNLAIKNGGDPLREYTRLMEAKGQAAAQAAIRMDNLNGDVEQLTGSLETLGIAVGKVAIPTLRQWVQGATKGVNTFTDTFQAAVGSGLNPFHAAGLGVVNALDQLTGGTTGATRVLRNFMGAMQRGLPIFQEMTETYEAMGDTGLAARIRALGNAVFAATGVDLQGATERLADFSNAVADFGDAVAAGDWDTAGDMLGDAIGTVSNWVLTIGAPAAISWAGDVLGTIGSWVQGQLQNLVGPGEPVTIPSVAVAIGEFVLEGAADLWGWLQSTLLGGGTGGLQGGMIDPGGARAPLSVGDVAVSVAGFVIENVGNLAGMIGTALQSAIQSVGSAVEANAERVGGDLGRLIGGALAAGINAMLSVGVSDGMAGLKPGMIDPGGAGGSIGAQMADSIDWGGAANDFITAFEAEFAAEMKPVEGKIAERVVQWLKEDLSKGPGGDNNQITQGPLLDWIAESMQGMSDEAIRIIDESSTKMQTSLQTSVDDFWDMITTTLSGENMQGLQPGMIDPGGGASGGGAAGIAESMINPIIEGFLTLPARLRQAAGSITGEITAAAGDFFQMIGDAFNSAFNGSTATGDAASGLQPIENAGFIDNIVTGLVESFKSIPQKIVDQLPDIDFSIVADALGAKLEEAMGGGATGGGALPAGVSALDMLLGGGEPGGFLNKLFGVQDAAAAEVDPAQLTKLGEDMGAQIGASLSSPEFLAGIETGITDQNATAFLGIGAALMTKINEGIGIAMREQTTGNDIEPPTTGGNMGATLVADLAMGLAASITEADATAFMPVGTAISGKLNEAIGLAMSGAEAGPTEAHGANMGAGATADMGALMVQGLATSLAASVTAADPTIFAAVGAAIQAKLTEAITTAMGAGAAEGGAAPAGGAEGAGAGIAQALVTSLAAQITAADFAAVGTAIQTKISEVMTTALSGGGNSMGGPGERGEAGTGIGATLVASIVEQVNGADWGAMTETFQAKAQEAAQGFTEGLTTGMANAVTAIMGAKDQILATLTAMSSEATTAGQQAGQGFADGITTGTAAAITAVMGAKDQMMATLNAMAGEATAAGTAAGTGFQSGIVAGMAAAVTSVMGSVAQITATLNSAAAGAQAAGAAVGAGFAAGIQSQLGAVQAAAASLVAAAQVGLEAAAQIASPSKLFAKLGGYIGDGFIAGILAKIEAARGAGAGLSHAAAAGATEAMRTEKPLSIGEQIGQGFWQGLLDSVPETLNAARFLVQMAVKEADGMAGKLMAKSRGHGMLAEFYRREFEAMDPWSDPAEFVKLQQKMFAQEAKAQSLEVSAINQQAADARRELDRAIARGGDRDRIRALRAEYRLLQQLADAQHRAYSAPDGSAAAEIAAMKVEFIQQKLEDLAGLDVGGEIGTDISRGMNTAMNTTERATNSMQADLEETAGVAEQAANALGTAYQQGGDTARNAVSDAMSKIHDRLGVGQQMGENAGTQLMNGVGSGVAGGTPDVQSMIDDIWSKATGGATSGGREVGRDFTSGLGVSLPNAADLAERIMADIERGFEGLGKVGTSSGRELGSGFATGLSSSNAPTAANRLVNLTTNNILTGGADAAQAAGDAGLDIGNSLTSGISRGGGDAIRTAGQVQNRIQNTLSGAFSKVNLGQVNTGGVVNSVKNTLNSIGNINSEATGTRIGTNLGAGIQGGVRDKTQSIRDQVIAAIDGAETVNTSGGSDLGKTFGQGLADGAATKGSVINTAVKKLVNDAYKAGMDAAKSKSPSRLFASMGETFPQGMAVGIDHEAGAVTASMRDLVRDAEAEAKAFDGSLGTVGLAGEGGGAGEPRSGVTEVHHHHAHHYDFTGATFERPEDFERFFADKAYETATSVARS